MPDTTPTPEAPALAPTPANRERWLADAAEQARAVFELEAGLELPPAELLAVSCGWPGGGSARRRIGEAWSASASADGKHETYISPSIADSREVLAVLIHELLHHAVGVEHGHKPAFARHLPALGISGGKPTATEPDAQFDALWGPALEALGPYPHSPVSPVAAKKQSTRMIKAECPQCGFVCRLSRKWLDEAGAPLCPTCIDDEGAPQQLEAEA